MPSSKISWEQLKREIDAGHPGIHRIKGTPDIDIFIEDNASRIGLRVPVDANYTLKDKSPLAEVQMYPITVEGDQFIQVSTSASNLYPEFISFINSAIERISDTPQDPESALIKTLRSWRSLLAPLSVLSEEQQLGLWGELFILECMINASCSVQCWIGPQKEPHDFRIDKTELEIKTTRGEHRVHIISNIDQLTPSVDHTLFLISIQVAPAGETKGESLSRKAKRLHELIKTKSGKTEADAFLDRLQTSGYREEHSNYYLGDLVLRTVPRAIPVNDTFPRITKNGLEDIIGSDYFRIQDVQYRIDVEGLGVEAPPGSQFIKAVGMIEQETENG